MTAAPITQGELVAVSLCIGAQLMVIAFSLILANSYRERALLLHAGAAVLAVLAIGAVVGGQPQVAEASILLLLGVAGLQLRDLVSHAGAMRYPRAWLVGTSAGLLPALAVASIMGWNLVLPGLAAWSAVVLVLMHRSWAQSRPWILWLAMAYLPLVAGSAWLGWKSLDLEPDPALPLAVFLTLWSAMNHLATTWRSRIFSETRVRVDARNVIDPLTGLAAPLVFYERVNAVRNLMRRYGHPSVLLLVHIDNLPALYSGFGPEVAESAVLVAANRIRRALGEGDVAARLSHSRVGVLCEGVGLAEGAANAASKILVAGLKEPLPAAPTEFLQFRVVMALVPATDVPAKTVLQAMSDRMDVQVREGGERRIATFNADEPAPAVTSVSLSSS